MMFSLRHPNIVSFIGVCQVDYKFLLVTEYMEKQSLRNVLEDQFLTLSTRQLIQFCLDVSLGILYMHCREPPVLHRDIKSSNCLVDRYFNVKLCDFGLSNAINKIDTSSKGNVYWLAPESLLEFKFSEKSDVYSLGILFWEIMHRDTQPYKNIVESNFYFETHLKESRPKIHRSVFLPMQNLIRSCWDFEPVSRPSMYDVVKKIEDMLLILPLNDTDL